MAVTDITPDGLIAVGDTLRNRRLALGISQAVLAAEAGVGAGAVSQRELGLVPKRPTPALTAIDEALRRLEAEAEAEAEPADQ
jgi:transcriptional regulator with XRE-family HTH domain